MERENPEGNSAQAELLDMTNHIEDLLEFHPELLAKLGDEDQDVLKKFFFAGREIDVENVADYQAGLEKSHPGVSMDARAAYRRLVELSKKPL